MVTHAAFIVLFPTRWAISCVAKLLFSSEDCWCRICDNACDDSVQLPNLEDAGGRFRSCWRSPRVGLDGSAMGWLACFWMPEADVLCTYFRHNAARIQEFH